MLEATYSGGESDDELNTVTTDTGPSIADDSDSDSDTDDELSDDLPLDVTFEILKNQRRRLVLEYLRDTDETITIGELAEHIAAIENDTTVQQLDAQQRKRVYIGLYQCHLPKMDDAGIIEFNQSRGRIDTGEHMEPLYEYLDVDANNDDQDSTSFKSIHVGGYAAFSSLFFAAQFTQAHTIATVTVVVFLIVVLAASYRAVRAS